MRHNPGEDARPSCRELESLKVSFENYFITYFFRQLQKQGRCITTFFTLRIRIQPTKGRDKTALGVFTYGGMIHQREADRKNTELSPAYQCRHSQGRAICLLHSPGQDLFLPMVIYSAYRGKNQTPGA